LYAVNKRPALSDTVLVAVIIAAGNAVAPSLTEKITGGMVTLVKGLFHSGGWLLMASALAVPMLVSFTGILWSKSHLLVVVVLVYSVAGTLLTALIGRRLVRLNFNQLRYEADFRYSLIHVRDHAESIAFYQGEGPEASQIGSRFRGMHQRSRAGARSPGCPLPCVA
jgi:ABC-type uncharacterized transport system fused permease/ATPase subunit